MNSSTHSIAGGLTAADFDGQAGDVFRRLKAGPLTHLDALRELGVSRLAAVVHNLRKSGVEVTTETVVVHKATGGTARVARYWLASARPTVEA